MSDWYYSQNGEQKGPVPTSELQGLVSGGGIDPEKDLVWREGMGDWKPAASVPELQLSGPASPAADAPPEGTTEQTINPYSAPGIHQETMVKGDLPTVKKANFMLVAVLTIIGVLGILGGYGWLIANVFLLSDSNDPEIVSKAMIAPMVLLYTFMIPSLIGGIIGLIHLHRAWTLLQPHTGYSTPGKAVGFLFIPFFNFYWYFVAYWRWAQEWNRLVANNPQHSQAPRASEGLFLTYPILMIACGILSIFGLIPLIIVYLLVQRTIARAVNYSTEG